MSYIFLYPSFVYFYEYNYITFIFYEILYPTVSTFVIAIFPNLTIKTEILQVERNLNRSNIILTPCLVLVIESIFFSPPTTNSISLPPQLSSALSLSRRDLDPMHRHSRDASQPTARRQSDDADDHVTVLEPSLHPRRDLLFHHLLRWCFLDFPEGRGHLSPRLSIGSSSLDACRLRDRLSNRPKRGD